MAQVLAQGRGRHGLRQPIRYGGSWNNGRNAGPFHLNLNDHRSNANPNIGFRPALGDSQKAQPHGESPCRKAWGRRPALLPKGPAILGTRSDLAPEHQQEGPGRYPPGATSGESPAPPPFPADGRIMMAKTYDNLFPQVASFEALHAGWRRVIRGRRLQRDVLLFERDLEGNLIDIQNALTWKTYRTGPYHHFQVFDPKRRDVAALPLKDRIVQHALTAVIEPIWETRYIRDSYACRPGKGTHAGADRAQHFIRSTLRRQAGGVNQGRIYALKADIAQYFASISHDVLKRLLRRRIACADTLWLLDEIIDSTAGDDPLPRGIPIGNLTSQIFANLYLHELDIYVKQELREALYLRYMDDFVVVGGDKTHLHEVRSAVESFLWAQLGLRLNGKTQIFPIGQEVLGRKAAGRGACRREAGGRALDFLGYRIWPDHRRLRRDSVGRMRRKMKRMARQYHDGRIGWEKVRAVTSSWIGHAGHADTYRLRTALLGAVAFVPPPLSAGQESHHGR
jgi:RNA-directed DNA polymerase